MYNSQKISNTPSVRPPPIATNAPKLKVYKSLFSLNARPERLDHRAEEIYLKIAVNE